MPNSTATKKPLRPTRTSAKTMRAAATGRPYPYVSRPAASGSDGHFGRVGVRQPGTHVRRVLVGPGDQLVAGLAVGLRQEARLHAEVHRLRVVRDDRDRRLLGLDGVA